MTGRILCAVRPASTLLAWPATGAARLPSDPAAHRVGTAETLVVVAALAVIASAPPALASDGERLMVTTLTVARYYPIGLDKQGMAIFKQRIGDSDELLFRTRFWSIGAGGAFNPANWTAKLEAEVEPIAVFQLKAAYEARGYFGNFGNIVSSAHPNMDITDAGLAAAADRGESRPTIGQTVSLQPTLQAAVGPIAVRSTFSASYGSWSVPTGNTVYYDPGPDLLLPANGITLSNSAAVVYRGGPFVAGSLYQWFNPLDVPNNMVHRVGALATWAFVDRGPGQGYFNKMSFFFLSLFNLQHRGRAGLFPTLILGLTTESDLLGSTGPSLK
jgi:hypothetical protein